MDLNGADLGCQSERRQCSGGGARILARLCPPPRDADEEGAEACQGGRSSDGWAVWCLGRVSPGNRRASQGQARLRGPTLSIPDAPAGQASGRGSAVLTSSSTPFSATAGSAGPGSARSSHVSPTCPPTPRPPRPGAHRGGKEEVAACRGCGSGGHTSRGREGEGGGRHAPTAGLRPTTTTPLSSGDAQAAPCGRHPPPRQARPRHHVHAASCGGSSE